MAKKTLIAALPLSLAAASASAASVDIVASLVPGQSGPVYSWSLSISAAPGEDVVGVSLFTRGSTASRS